MSTAEDITQTLALGRAVDFIRATVSELVPRVGIVLGSGLGGLVDAIDQEGSIAYTDIPGFPASTVEGHGGQLVIGHLAGLPVAVMQGRVHMYEGYSPQAVVFPVRVLVRLGATALVITNAAGGVNPDFEERELMVIRDHLNLTGRNPLVGPNDLALGPRFPDMSDAYDPELRQLAHEVAEEQGLRLREGVYAGLLGPSYETPAEVRMLGILGADAVGMSTVTEVIAARHMGARVLGISCISNKGAGLSSHPLSHDEVKAAGQAVQAQMIGLIQGVAASLARAS
jgi:purine-nucleoside phosphorylase